MYYKELARRLRRRYLDSLGNVVLQKPADVYSDCNHAATAITDLLARAEAAEARCARLEEARENANEACAKWETLCHMAEQERDQYKSALQNWHEEG